MTACAQEADRTNTTTTEKAADERGTGHGPDRFLARARRHCSTVFSARNTAKRIAVIENEFGEIGIDHELVVQSDEEIFEMNNGCICCTVRGDLIRILGRLMRRKHKFDHIIIETTGMADPGPVAQTFFMDEETKEKLRLDAIVTVVDAHHVLQHIDSDECHAQLAFADVVVLNKCDLVDDKQLHALESQLRSINRLTDIHRTVRMPRSGSSAFSTSTPSTSGHAPPKCRNSWENCRLNGPACTTCSRETTG